MRISGPAVFSLFLAALAAFAAVSASSWSFKTALFPLATAIPLFVLALIQLVLELRGGEKDPSPAMDLAAAAGTDEKTARRRVLSVFAWMGAFIVLVLLAGFSLAVPLFLFPYLMVHGGLGLWRSLAFTAAAWAFFYGLFERLLRLPFGSGIVQTWLGF